MNANGTNAIPSRSQNPYNTPHQQNVGVEPHSLPQNDQPHQMFLPSRQLALQLPPNTSLVQHPQRNFNPYSTASTLPSQFQFNSVYQYNNNGYNQMLSQSHPSEYAQMMNQQQQLMNQNYQVPIPSHQQHYSPSLQTSHAQPTQPLNLQTQQAQHQMLPNVGPIPSTIQPPKKKNILRIEDPETKTLINSQDLEGTKLTTSTSTIASVAQRNNNDEKKADVQNRFMQSIMVATLKQDKNQITQQTSNLNTEETSQIFPEREASKSEKGVPESLDTTGVRENLISSELEGVAKQNISANPDLPIEANLKRIEEVQNSHEKSPIKPVESRTEERELSQTRELTPVESIVKKYIAKEPATENLSNEMVNEQTTSITLVFDEVNAENGIIAPLDPVATRQAKINKFEEEMSVFTNNYEEKAKLDSLVYSSEFLYLMRNIVKELRHVDCLKSPSELFELGIDRASMPANSLNNKLQRGRFENSRDTFVPTWQQNTTSNRMGNRPSNYMGRHSDNKLRSKKPVPGRPSMDRIPRAPQDMLPKRSANAWLPRRAEKTTEKSEEEIRIDNIKKEIRGLLNKVTPSTYDALVEEFCAYKVHRDNKLLPVIIDLIFDKAVEEPRFCPLYSDLCKKQVSEERADKETNSNGFFQGIISKCQNTFLDNSDVQIKAEELELEAETDEAKKPVIVEKIYALKSKEKRRLLGIIKFIAQLYRHDLLINNIINWCVVELVKRYQATNEDVYIEYAVQMIRTVGLTYERKKKENGEEEAVDRIISHLSTLKVNLSNRVRFMIMDLEDLKKNNWVDKKEQVPKTMEEVRNEHEKEQIDNQAEREAYDRKVAMRGDYNRKDQPMRGQRSNYGGRGSIDNNNRSQISEKRTAAVLASSLTSTGQGFKKDTDLRKVEAQKLGRTKFFPSNSSASPSSGVSHHPDIQKTSTNSGSSNHHQQ